MCVDYRQLNRVTIPDAEPMPNQEDLFIKLSQAKIFSKLDLSRGYFQIGLEENSKHLKAFISPYGLYQYNFLSFGLVKATETFNRMMRKLLQGRNDVISYLDDVLIFHDTWTEHIQGIKSILQLLRQNGLTAKPSKCEIGMEKIKFLGHVISKGQVRPVLDTTKKILELKQPKTKKELRGLIGLCNYYRKFIPNFATIMELITALTKGGNQKREAIRKQGSVLVANGHKSVIGH